MKNTRKGFTLVELLVVIAIIAILATVAVVGYTSFINKAQLSVDEQTTEQMNIALEAESVLAKPERVEDVIGFLANAGFNMTNGIVPTMEGYTFYWYKTYNVIVLVHEEDGSVYAPAEKRDMVEAFKTDFANNKNNIYSLDLTANADPNRLFPDGAPVAQVPPYELGSSGKDTDFVNKLSEKGWLYTFYPSDDGGVTYEDQREEYADWIADFAIILNDDFAKETAGIIGQYWALNWERIDLPEDSVAGTTFLLMKDGYQDVYKINYKSLVDTCKPNNGERDGFNCGAYNFDEANIGKSITVQLRLYEVDENNERTGKYIVCNEIVLEFDSVVER